MHINSPIIEQETHGPHHSSEKSVQINKHLTVREGNMGNCHPEKTNVDRGVLALLTQTLIPRQSESMVNRMRKKFKVIND